MEIREFFDELKAIRDKYEWRIENESIRGLDSEHHYCPITALYNSKFGEYCHINDYSIAADLLGISSGDTSDIVAAADRCDVDNQNIVDELRHEMRNVLGL